MFEAVGIEKFMFIPEGVDILFLDDDPERHRIFREFLSLGNRKYNVVPVWDFFQAVDELKKKRFHTVFLDHDLNDYKASSIMTGMYSNRELTGVDVANYIFNNLDAHPKQCIVHSHNPPGAKNIASIMKRVCPTEVVPFGSIFTNIG